MNAINVSDYLGKLGFEMDDLLRRQRDEFAEDYARMEAAAA